MTHTPRTRLGCALRATALAFVTAVLALALPPPTSYAAPPPAPPASVWPLSPRPAIVRGFEPPPRPWLPGHRGLDLAGSPGQPVLSATAGTITYAGPLAGRGVVVVTSGPFRTTYEPVVPTTHKGATVTPGTQLGTLSTAGTHCPPHPCLHWGLLNSATYLNPLALLSSRPVRLLPQTPTTDAQLAGNTQHRPITDARGRPASDAQVAGTTDRPPPTAPAPTRSSSPADRSTRPASVVVGIAAALTLGGALLIRRH